MRHAWLIPLVLLAISCAKGSKGDDGSADSTEAPDPIVIDATTKHEFKFANTTEVKREGEGRGWPEFELKMGAAIFEYENKGPGHFKITISDGEKEIDTIAEDVEDLKGRHISQINGNGKHTVLFATDDKWSISTIAPKVLTSIPMHMEGSNCDVSDVFPLKEFQKIHLNVKNSGDGAFSLIVYDASTGEKLETLVNEEVNDFEKEYVFTSKTDAHVILGVETYFANLGDATKSWSIDIN